MHMQNRARQLSVTVLSLALLAAPIAASAVPFTFRFNMPAFLGGGFAGLTSVLDVSVDNGGTSALNQSFLNTDITDYAVSIDTTTASLSGPVTSTTGSTTYITTNGAGVPVLDLSIDLDTSAIATVSAGNSIQLGTRDNGGPTQYAVSINGILGLNGNDLVVTGTLLQLSVPAPATLGLLVAGIGLVGLRSGGKFSRRARGSA